jgi:hypothetical protein
MPFFARTIGIDYSGAQTPTASLPGLRVYLAEGDAPPVEILPPPSPRKYWSRRGIAEWLVERLAEDAPTLVGIDHGFSFPLRYFEAHGPKFDWPAFLDDFQRHWPTDEDHAYVDFVRDGAMVGDGAARTGNACWQRLTEEHACGALIEPEFEKRLACSRCFRPIITESSRSYSISRNHRSAPHANLFSTASTHADQTPLPMWVS